MASKKKGEFSLKFVISLPLIAALILFAVGAYFYNLNKSQNEKSQAETLLVPEYAYIAGNKDAKVTVVEFFDPACPACAAKAPSVARIPELYNYQVRVVYRSLALHNGSDLVLSLLEAAKEQGKFKEALAAFSAYYTNWFVNNKTDAFTAWGVLEKSGVDLEKAKIFLDNNQAKIDDMLRQNMEDAAALEVDSTPTFFVNGIKIKQNELIAAIESELIKSYEGEK
ncbi:MAG: thioredoxin domain-containing protein [Campylobacteraceae bacterium]|jgi:protein-disulfide isomerase|nr:thioredoxin domain-containing protein [Campylobacteraceae bacterium]